MAKAAAATTTSTAAAAQSQFDAFSRIIHMESSPWDSSLLCCLRNRFLTV